MAVAGADPLATRHPRAGIEEWVNVANGLTVVRVHYTADPRKRDPAWKADAGRSMAPRAWKREYEIDWSAPEGEPVIPEYQETLHRKAFQIDTRLRLLRFWDFGFDSPCVLFAQLALSGQLRIRSELCPFNVSLAALVPMVRAMSVQLLGPDAMLGDNVDVGGDDQESETLAQMGLMPKASAQADRFFDAGDPAGTHRYDTGTATTMLANLGIRVRTIRKTPDESYDALRARFLRQVTTERGPEPAIVIHPECQSLHAALAGAFSRSSTPPYKPQKTHPHKDVVDALRYGNDNLDAASAATARDMARMAAVDRIDSIGTWELRTPPPDMNRTW